MSRSPHKSLEALRNHLPVGRTRVRWQFFFFFAFFFSFVRFRSLARSPKTLHRCHMLCVSRHVLVGDPGVQANAGRQIENGASESLPTAAYAHFLLRAV